jgi:hypothetical protein
MAVPGPFLGLGSLTATLRSWANRSDDQSFSITAQESVKKLAERGGGAGTGDAALTREGKARVITRKNAAIALRVMRIAPFQEGVPTPLPPRWRRGQLSYVECRKMPLKGKN